MVTMDELTYKIKGNTTDGKVVYVSINKFQYSVLNSMHKFGMKDRIKLNPSSLKGKHR